MRARLVATLAALCALSACTIEQTRQVGDDCLQDRECAAGLRCQLGSDGLSRCAVPVRFDVPLTDATGDTPADVSAPETTPADVNAPETTAADGSAADASAADGSAPDASPADASAADATAADGAARDASDAALDGADGATDATHDGAADAERVDGSATTDA